MRASTLWTPPGVVAHLAWIDHQRTRVALYPGGEVPRGLRGRLLATFNGGFKPGAGAGGMAIDGRVLIPLRRGLGTVVAYRGGRVDVLDWQGWPPTRRLALARQNLPLLVAGGRPAPGVRADSSWGATLHRATAVWRSALGVNQQGNLLYAAADAQTAPSLAALMVRIGAVRAIELDINAQWPTFNTYGAPGGRAPAKLVPNAMQSAQRWLVPDGRDFFAVYSWSR